MEREFNGLTTTDLQHGLAYYVQYGCLVNPTPNTDQSSQFFPCWYSTVLVVRELRSQWRTNFPASALQDTRSFPSRTYGEHRSDSTIDERWSTLCAVRRSWRSTVARFLDTPSTFELCLLHRSFADRRGVAQVVFWRSSTVGSECFVDRVGFEAHANPKWCCRC